MTRRGFRILCYHGFSLADEHEWSADMFMSGAFFRRRMELIAASGMPVVPLEQVLRDDYPDHAIAITIDDGWEGTLRVAAPILQEFSFPATLYLSSYYSATQTQVFNVLADYLLWKTAKPRVSLPEWSIDIEIRPGAYRAALSDLRQLGHRLGQVERQRLADELSQALGVDSTGLFYYLSLDQAKELDRLGIDLQLHTHRHRFDGIGREDAIEEVQANRAYLDGVRPAPRQHFCYPSGSYSGEQLAWLRDLDIQTATTCESGLNYPGQDPLQLHRMLDSQSIPEDWFMAMLEGIPFVARSPLDHLRRLGRAG
jgi:peptidoglycan/xylan/chitin deacetylase (PgdA/CDA1 family)